MAGANREEIFDVSAEQFYNALLDYENYAEILGEVDEIDILEFSEEGAKIQYSVNVVKKFSYTLKMTHERPNLVAWELDSGSLFKKNSGRWEIEDLGDNKCKVVYNLDVALKVFAPKAITNKLVAVSLPRMMKTFYEHAKGL